MSTKEKHLYYLTELKDYKVNSKDPDIRGWRVKDLDSRITGKVDDLLVNMELGKVVYVDVEVDQAVIDTNHDPYSAVQDSQIKEFINKDGENHIIIPIGLVDLNLDDKYVYTETIDYQTFAETKRYRSGTHVSRAYERHVLGSYDRRNKNVAEPDVKNPDHNRHNNPEENIRETEVEAKIRREKENMKYKSEDRKTSREPSESRNRTTDRFTPERTLDEEDNWTHDNSGIDQNINPEPGQRKKAHNDDFYDRDEFRNRERY